MYVVTFYSYKGGVGRSMALANVAYLLAQAGKKVLAVDFDLEAPGLSSYGPFRCAGNRKGLVEYVLDFEEANIAPDFNDYVQVCDAGDHRIWLMPAGLHTEPGYAAKFSAINWQELYAERDGFLLFEDLKQQWAAFEEDGFDYVLIDSRTGHTDIGGICTRQLPDAVVVMFLPTPQNIEGLHPIVRSIRRESAPVRRERVKLHFCPSNLPDLDDQELILKKLLDEAQKSLGYTKAACEIHHYSSLDLLQQPIYTLSYPTTRLAKEYEALLTSIIGHNLADRDGAITALARMNRSFPELRKTGDRAELELIQADAALIAGRFPDDVQIAWGLAELASQMTRPEDELLALNCVIEGSSDRGFALLRRATVRATLEDQDAAIDDLRRLLTEERTGIFEAKPAAELLLLLEEDPADWRAVIERAVLNPLSETSAKVHMLMSLLNDRAAASAVRDLAETASQQFPDAEKSISKVGALALIANGEFALARDALASQGPSLLHSDTMSDVFNYAICDWAVTQSPPMDIFARVLALASQYGPVSDANGLQCFALCHMVLGQYVEASDALQRAQLSAKRATTVFSCWRYLTVSSSEMLEDLAEMASLAAHQVRLKPPIRDGLKAANQFTT